MLKNFQEIGEDLFVAGIISSHGGSLSVREKNKIYITREGVCLNRIGKDDILELDLKENKEEEKDTPPELVVHRSIYETTEHKAVIHAHPIYTVILSFTDNKVVPQDAEGVKAFQGAPIVKTNHAVASDEIAKLLQPIFTGTYKVAVIKSHGSFAVGEKLDEAFKYTCAVERSSQIIITARIVGSRQAPGQQHRHEKKSHQTQHKHIGIMQPVATYPPRRKRFENR